MYSYALFRRADFPGLLGGMGGAAFAQSISGNFFFQPWDDIVPDKGFISMAAMILVNGIL